MRRALLVLILASLVEASVASAKQPWRHGVWRDVQFVPQNDG
jgi:hypothetical protein